MNSELERWMRRFCPPSPPPDLRRRIFGTAGGRNGKDEDHGKYVVAPIAPAKTRYDKRADPLFNVPMLVTSLSAGVGVLIVGALIALKTAAPYPSPRPSAPLPSPLAKVGAPAEELEIAPATNTADSVTRPSFDGRPSGLVACVSGLINPVWGEAGRAYVIHDRLRSGDRVCLQSGRVLLVFDCGVQLVLEGPADFEILGEKKARMQFGIITARAWTGGEGFTIDTPQVDIVDLSTEFGVRVAPSGKTDVAVFEGAIDVFREEPPAPVGEGERIPERLEQGDVVQYSKEDEGTEKPATVKIRGDHSEIFNIIDWHDRVTSDNRSGVNIMDLEGVVVDAGRADCTGDWICSRQSGKWVGDWYYHDMSDDSSPKSIRFAVRLPESGWYEVRMSYSAYLTNEQYRRASNVPVDIEHSNGCERIRVDHRDPPPIDDLFVSLGKYHFDSGREAVVTVRNDGADGFVTADAIQFLPVKEQPINNSPLSTSGTEDRREARPGRSASYSPVDTK